MALHSVVTAVAFGMYGITGNEYDGLKVALVFGGINAAMLIKEGGIDKIVDVVGDNKIFFLGLLLPTIYIALF